jgi:hypothetical protein
MTTTSLFEPLEPRTLLSSSGYNSIGTKPALYVIARFADQTSYPQTIPDAQSSFDSVDAFWQRASYGAFQMTPTILQVTLPKKASQYSNGWAVLADAKAAAKKAGYDDANFPFDAVRYDGGPGSFGGMAYIAGKGALIKENDWGVLAHEFGHNLGLDHAHSWRPSTSDPAGPGHTVEYGDHFDVMADPYDSPDSRQYNVFEKIHLGWLLASAAENVTQDGTYTLYAHDLGNVDVAQTHALTFHGRDGKTYWLDLREDPADSAAARDGVFLRFASAGATWLIDAKPSTSTVDDAPIPLGSTFSDATIGASIHPLSRQSDPAGGISVTLQVDFGPFITARPSRPHRNRATATAGSPKDASA